jgi:hypothetical protein
MNLDNEQQLARRIDRELKALGELEAPAALASRVLRAIELRMPAPWYRRAWQTWPVAWQAASLATMVALFAGICLGLPLLAHAATATSAADKVGEWTSGFGFVWRTLNVLVGAVAASVKQIGTTWIIGGLALVAVMYAGGLSVGAAFLRVGLARR